ncbi:MAG TPA: alginate lyase family protein [Thermoguttaceae bacterium]|nr:alginate lyase family protein [Thermoguttaceae bacterium]
MAHLTVATIGLCLLTASAATGQEDVDLVFADYQQLAAKKIEYRQRNGKTQSSYKELVANADRAMGAGLVTVMQKTRVAPSHDPHDYLSLAPYWWPDPNKANGLPYIRRDGRTNPTTRGNNVDYPAKQHLFDRVNALGMAAFYTEDPKYAQQAVAQLEAWFVDPTTRMNPHLQYAQGVPGRNDGRCFGIIEWCNIDRLITPIQLLRVANAIPEPTDQAITEWFETYLQWLQTSELGIQERDRLNNHGTWYDVQVAGILLFLGKRTEACEVLESVKTNRIATQIEPDGRQPQELARTKSLSYSKMNLNAFQTLARLGEKAGVDLWNYETPDGRSILKAQEFLAPYVQGNKKWEYPQL